MHAGDQNHNIRASRKLAPNIKKPTEERMKILLVDDNETDVSLFSEAFESLGLDHELRTARDGAAAIELLSNRSEQPPSIILLDVNTPETGGFNVLSAIRADPRLCIIPVIMMSASSDQRDVRRAHELGANSFVCKPAHDFTDMVGDFDRFWLRRAELPKIVET
jgi:CheY-like chemotaxis protein